MRVAGDGARASADRRGRLGDGRRDESRVGRRAAAFLDVAECVSSSFAATAAMRDLASELARRAREDAVDARDGRVAAVEKTVARFCAAARKPDRLWAFR